jgi:hypothetical protein
MTTRRHIVAVEAGGHTPPPSLGIGVPGVVIPHEGCVTAPVNPAACQTAIPAAVDLIEKLVPGAWREGAA